MVSFFIFSAPLLVIRGSPPCIRSGQRKRRGRSNSNSTRQTVSVFPIRPSPLTRGQPPLPAVPSRLLGAKSHKTSVSAVLGGGAIFHQGFAGEMELLEFEPGFGSRRSGLQLQ